MLTFTVPQPTGASHVLFTWVRVSSPQMMFWIRRLCSLRHPLKLKLHEPSCQPSHASVVRRQYLMSRESCLNLPQRIFKYSVIVMLPTLVLRMYERKLVVANVLRRWGEPYVVQHDHKQSFLGQFSQKKFLGQNLKNCQKISKYQNFQKFIIYKTFANFEILVFTPFVHERLQPLKNNPSYTKGNRIL